VPEEEFILFNEQRKGRQPEKKFAFFNEQRK